MTLILLYIYVLMSSLAIIKHMLDQKRNETINTLNTGEVDTIITSFPVGSEQHAALLRVALMLEYRDTAAQILSHSSPSEPAAVALATSYTQKAMAVEHEIEMEAAFHPTSFGMHKTSVGAIQRLTQNVSAKDSLMKTAIQNKDIATDQRVQRISIPIPGTANRLYATPAMLTRGYIQAAMVNRVAISSGK